MSQDSNTAVDEVRIATRRLDTEVAAKAVRRRFAAEYKLRILEEAEACSSGEIGALLRREGLYSSHLMTWRRQREAGQLAGLAAKKRGPKPNPEVEELKRLQVRLQQAEAIIEAQKNWRSCSGWARRAKATSRNDSDC